MSAEYAEIATDANARAAAISRLLRHFSALPPPTARLYLIDAVQWRLGFRAAEGMERTLAALGIGASAEIERDLCIRVADWLDSDERTDDERIKLFCSSLHPHFPELLRGASES